MAQTSKNPDDAIVRELSAIKRLLILQLVTSGVEARHIALVLGISKSSLSGLVPARSVKVKPRG